MDISKAPKCLTYRSLDEVAECVDGLTSETYNELWGLLVEAKKAGTDKPLGGDGSDGTTEEPIVSSGEYGSDLVAGWPKLSESARQNICEAVAPMTAEWEAQEAEWKRQMNPYTGSDVASS